MRSSYLVYVFIGGLQNILPKFETNITSNCRKKEEVEPVIFGRKVGSSTKYLDHFFFLMLCVYDSSYQLKFNTYYPNLIYDLKWSNRGSFRNITTV